MDRLLDPGRVVRYNHTIARDETQTLPAKKLQKNLITKSRQFIKLNYSNFHMCVSKVKTFLLTNLLLLHILAKKTCFDRQCTRCDAKLLLSACLFIYFILHFTFF